MALPDKPIVTDGDGQFRPSAGLAQAISQHERVPSEQDLLRWKTYEGIYGARVWGVLDPARAVGRVHIQGSHLYLTLESDELDELCHIVGTGI